MQVPTQFLSKVWPCFKLGPHCLHLDESTPFLSGSAYILSADRSLGPSLCCPPSLGCPPSPSTYTVFKNSHHKTLAGPPGPQALSQAPSHTCCPLASGNPFSSVCRLIILRFLSSIKAAKPLDHLYSSTASLYGPFSTQL